MGREVEMLYKKVIKFLLEGVVSKVDSESDMKTVTQGLPFEAIDRSLSLIDHLNTRQAIEFSIAYSVTNWRITTGNFGRLMLICD